MMKDANKLEGILANQLSECSNEGHRYAGIYRSLPAQIRNTKPNVDSDKTDLDIWTWEENDKPYGIAFQGKAGKPLWYNYFRNPSSRDQKIKITISNRKGGIKDKLRKLQEKKEFTHNVQIGDIFVSSWGYDQTNVDFYQVTKVMGKQIAVRPIDNKEQGSSSHGTVRVVPNKNRFTGSEEKHIIRQGNPINFKVNSFSSASLWDGKPRDETSTNAGH